MNVVEWLQERGRNCNEQATVYTRQARGLRTTAAIHYEQEADLAFKWAKELELIVQQEASATSTKIAKLREAIRVYGGHIPDCSGRPCTCGFKEVWDSEVQT